MKKENFVFFICPVCKNELEYKAENNVLECKKCGKTYPVVDGIPILTNDREVMNALRTHSIEHFHKHKEH